MTSTIAPAHRRRIPKRTVALAAAVAGASVVALTLASPASADPTGTYVAVGSDTVQDVENALATAIGGGLLGSYNAFDPANNDADGNALTRQTGALKIQTKPGTAAIPRPNGSGDGVAAMAAAQGGTVQNKAPFNAAGSVPSAGSIDIARSSSGPSSFTLADGTTPVTTGASGLVDFIPFAIDAVTFAAGPSSILGANSKQFTLQNVKDLFGKGFDVTVNGTVYHPLNGVGTNSTGTATPAGSTTLDLYVPQNGSGTLKFWAAQTGFSASSIPAWDHQTEVAGLTNAGNQVEEHDGSVLNDDPAGIAPFSIAQWIAQSKAVDATPAGTLPLHDRRHGAIIEPINPGTGAINPTTGGYNGSGVPTGNLNTGFPIVREVFNVITKAELAADATLKSMFVSTSSSSLSLLCSNSLVITRYGFGLLTGSGTFGTDYCGTVANTSLQAMTAGQF